MHIYKPIIPSLFWFHWWFYIIRQSGGWQFLFSVLSDSSVKKGIWITDNPVVSSDKLNSSSPKTILVFPSTVTRKHHCFKMWWQPTLCYWVQQKLECTEQTKLDTEWCKLCCTSMFSSLRNTVAGIVKRGDSLRKQRKEQGSSAAHGNHAEDSSVLHSSQHGEPRAGCSLRKIKILFHHFCPLHSQLLSPILCNCNVFTLIDRAALSFWDKTERMLLSYTLSTQLTYL